VRIAVEQTRARPGSGKVALEADAVRKKIWLASSFRLQIDGLDCTKVTSVAPITVKLAVAENAVGELRDVEKLPAGLEVSDLVVTLAEVASESWASWLQSFMVEGRNDQGAEKSGTLQYLSPDGTTVLFTLGLHGLGIYKLAPVRQQSEASRRVVASLYCEQIQFAVGPAKMPAPLRRRAVT
jgi:hypothetical protein